MTPRSRRLLLVWLGLSLAGAGWLAAQTLAERQARFLQDTSITHRLLSQKAVQHEAVLATLAVLPQAPPPAALFPGLHSALPQLLALGRWHDGRWYGDGAAPSGLAAAVTRASRLHHPLALPAGDGRYWLAHASGWALLIDSRRLLAAGDWPAALGNVQLQLPQGPLMLLQRQPAAPWPGWTLAIDKPLAASGQPFALHSRRVLTPGEWPWVRVLLWSALCAGLLAGITGWQENRAAARRERERARLAAVARLNTLGEMAAGLAHELNQPLTAILAHTRAAVRLLDDPDEQDSVRQALRTSAEQARRAADIIARLRALVTQADTPVAVHAVDPDRLLDTLRFLLEPELHRHDIRLDWHNASPGRYPLGERVALEQILHNLLQNAIAALRDSSLSRRIEVGGVAEGGHYRFTVGDNGPGIAAEALPRLFEPFYSTRPGGMGLGLSLCETLAGSLNGRLTAANRLEGGASFTLTLPLAKGDPT